MERPMYPPAAAYEPPIPVPYEKISTATTSLAALKSSPAAWEIVVKHAPLIQLMSQGPLAGAFGNMTADAFVSFGDISQQALDQINAELAQLPRSKWPTE